MPQWLNTCRTSTSATNQGLRPSTAQASSSSGSRVRRAKPLTRSVSEMPGTTKSRPMPGGARGSARRRSGDCRGTRARAGVYPSSTWTKPGGPALRAGVARSVRARRRHDEERRGRDELPRAVVERRHLLRHHARQRLAEELPQLLGGGDLVRVGVDHESQSKGSSQQLRKFPCMGDSGMPFR